MVPTEVLDLDMFGSVMLDIEQAFMNADYEELLQDFIPVLERGEAQAYASEATPGGSPWPQLSPVTIKAKGHDTILVESGRMRASLIGETGDSIRETSHRGLLFGTSVEYAGIHQDGGGRIPQREHVGMSEETCNGFVEAIADYTVELLKSTV